MLGRLVLNLIRRHAPHMGRKNDADEEASGDSSFLPHLLGVE
jgi:hypothetical protein